MKPTFGILLRNKTTLARTDNDQPESQKKWSFEFEKIGKDSFKNLRHFKMKSIEATKKQITLGPNRFDQVKVKETSGTQRGTTFPRNYIFQKQQFQFENLLL